MAERDTLLAHLVPKLTNQVENAATDALAFILNASASCRSALDGLLRDGNFNPEPVVRVETQITYQDDSRSRPDMVGYDRTGARRLLVEAKFWASLQEDQASRYVDRLDRNGPGVLLFVAPASRIETLWAEIKRQMESGEGPLRLEELESDEQTRKADVLGSDKRVLLISWDKLLGVMALAVDDNAQITSDIQQLRGLVKYQDEEAFQPIHREELGLALPRRIRGLNRLIDDVVDARGVPQGWMNTSGLRATPQREGYGRYFRFSDIAGSLGLFINYMRWATSADTPLWLWIGGEVPVRRRESAAGYLRWLI